MSVKLWKTILYVVKSVQILGRGGGFALVPLGALSGPKTPRRNFAYNS